MNENGFTLLEVVVAIGLIIMVVVGGLFIWVAFHFISKFW
jgi:type II secretory pathway pseudopilin PulG